MYFGRKDGHARVDESKLGRWLPGLLYLTNQPVSSDGRVPYQSGRSGLDWRPNRISSESLCHMCLLLLGRSVPCKTGYIKKCLPVSGTVFTKLSNTSVVIGLPKQTSAIVFRDRDIFAHSSIVSSRTLSGTGLIAVLGSSFLQLTD